MNLLREEFCKEINTPMGLDDVYNYVKWLEDKLQQQEKLEELPSELEPVLAKITHQNDLGLSQWYEVVYYADDRWCSYSGSKTFQDGERVIEWKYCKDQFLKEK